MTKALFMAAAAGGSVAPTYVDDVFSTWLYTGNGSTQTITNGIDLAGQGGLVWVKSRNNAIDHSLMDTVRGASNSLSSNTTTAEATPASISAFLSTGFSLGTSGASNLSAYTYASWTFRKAPKFFDVVTWTGNATNRDIAHSLGVAPGCIMVKRTDTAGDWQVYHRSLANTEYLVLNSTAAKATGATRWNSTTAGVSTFRIGTDASVNANGGTYVAYLFAHDTATDGLIQCGSVSYTGSVVNVNLGWEPQYLLWKNASSTQSWSIFDTMRGWGTDLNNANSLFANLSDAEGTGGGFFTPTATGVTLGAWYGSGEYIYIAIRRPNKPPTVGTEVFGNTANSNNIVTSTPVALTPVASDLWINATRTGTTSKYWLGRLSGWLFLQSDSNAAEAGASYQPWSQKTQSDLYPAVSWWSGSPSQVNWFFKRAPGFFDVVCDNGTGSAHTVVHSLGAVPELIIRKGRSGSTDWQVYAAGIANTEKLVLNTTAAKATDTAAWNSTTPTATAFTVGTGASVNTGSSTYISYLFATLAGISKVGTYTGNGSSQTINCGFTTGARFVLIKRTDATGDWLVWDTARGIVSGNDPHLSLNTTAAEVTTDDTIDPDTSGFVVNQVAATNVNVNAATYIYLAIA